MRIKHAWTDIRQGENVDLYLALVLSATFFVLGLFGAVHQTAVLSLALLVLGLITYSLIGLRWQTRRLEDYLATVAANKPTASQFFSQRYLMDDIVTKVRQAERILLWGTTLSAHIPFLLGEIRDALARGAHVQVLLIARDGIAMEMAAHRSQQDSDATLQRYLDNALASLREISAHQRAGQLEVRLVDYLAPYVAYFFDPDSDNGQSMIRLASFSSQRIRPTFWLAKRHDALWYEYFLADFKRVWESAATTLL